MRIFGVYAPALLVGVAGTIAADALPPGWGGWAFVAGVLFGGCYAAALIWAAVQR